ncbi:hypothetical protein PAENIP36_35090 [Paenibacillus sp. P36]
MNGYSDTKTKRQLRVIVKAQSSYICFDCHIHRPICDGSQLHPYPRAERPFHQDGGAIHEIRL